MSRKQKQKFIFAVILVTSSFLIGLTAVYFPFQFFWHPTLHLGEYHGRTKQEIRGILGVPSRKWGDDMGNTYWEYRKWFSKGWFTARFDVNEVFDHYDIDLD